MLNYKRIILIICIVVISIYVVRGVREAESNYRDLAKDGILSIATIVKKEERVKRNKVVYHYSFKANGVSYKRVVKYDYDWEDMGLNIGDSIYILYSLGNIEFNCDYRYLKENDYGVDTVKYEQEMHRIGFYERSFSLSKNNITIKF